MLIERAPAKQKSRWGAGGVFSVASFGGGYVSADKQKDTRRTSHRFFPLSKIQFQI